MYFSVVMANYNCERYIEDAIKSVLDQDERNFEFIIVDDASTDESVQIIEKCRQISDGRIKFMAQNKNGGQGASLNIGISAATGDIVCLLDSDDIWFSNKLSNVKKIFARENNYAFHQHNLVVMRDSELTANNFKNILVSGNYFAYTKRTRKLPTFTPTSGLSFKRHILNRVLPIPSAFKTCADGYLTRTTFCHGEVSANVECWGAYRIHGNNHTIENQKFDSDKYTNDLLVPHVNQYYVDNGIDLRLHRKNFVTKLLSVSMRKVLRDTISEPKYRRFERFIEDL